MKNQSAYNDLRPPRLASWWLRTYCRRELLEDLEGDLHECFLRNTEISGLRQARFIYCWDVLKFMRLYTLKKPKIIQLLIHWIMLHSYIKTSGRSLLRNKMFSAINIIGLAASMSAGMLMISLLTDLTSFDQIHEDREHIFRLNTWRQHLDEEPEGFASTSVKAGRLIADNVAGIDDMVILSGGFSGDAHYENKVVPVSGIYSQPSFFHVFSFPLLEGNPTSALTEPYSIVLTEKTAKKIFGNTPALNQSIRVDTLEYVVTGVLQDLPKFSHLQFESLVSFSTAEIRYADWDFFESWSNIWSNYVYMRLSDHTEPQDLQAGLDYIAGQENAELENDRLELKLQPMSAIVLGEDLSNQVGTTIPDTFIYIILGLALIVMVSACFNYTNLSIARALRRSREVGIRKVIGAQRLHVLGQFLTESVVLSLFSMVMGILLFILIRPHFLTLDSSIGELANLEITPELLGYFLLLALGIGVLAGILPAIFFSRIHIIDVLKDTTRLKVFQHLTMKKVLLVSQYAFSLIFITSTLIAYQQYRSYLAFDLGFRTENILNVRVQGNDTDRLFNEFSSLPEVEDISKSMMVTSVGTYFGSYMKYERQDDSVYTYFNGIDENYLPIHGHQFVAGRNFDANVKEEHEVIVNEKMLTALDIQDPESAIGETITIDGQSLQIIGVLKDFQYGRADREVTPVAFRNRPDEIYNFVNLQVSTNDPKRFMEKLETAWKKVDTIHPFEATFYDQQIAHAFSEFTVIVKIIGFLAFLSICIASMGLLGMVVFTTETRVREISIRKVFGADTAGLLLILGRSFLILLFIAALIALPLTYVLFDQVILAEFANRSPIGPFELLSGLVSVLVIAVGLILLQALQVVHRNPAEVLKAE